MEPSIVLDGSVIVFGLGVAALAGQSWAYQRAQAKKLDETNSHLSELNGKTYKTHGQTQRLAGAIDGLPCRVGEPSCVVPDEEEDDNGVAEG